MYDVEVERLELLLKLKWWDFFSNWKDCDIHVITIYH